MLRKHCEPLYSALSQVSEITLRLKLNFTLDLSKMPVSPKDISD